MGLANCGVGTWAAFNMRLVLFELGRPLVSTLREEVAWVLLPLTGVGYPHLATVFSWSPAWGVLFL